MQEDFSLKALYSFLNYVIDKGLINKNTARNWKIAVSKFESLIKQDGHENDLQKVVIKDLTTRFNIINSNGAFTPGTMTVYASRLNRAFEDFFSYTKNPSGYRPNLQKNIESTKKENVRKKSSVNDLTKENLTSSLGSIPSPAFVLGLSIPIPIRQEMVISINGVPADLSHMEAEKIATIIKGYAVGGQSSTN